MANKHLPADRHGNNLDVSVSCFFCNSRFSQNDYLLLEENDRKTVFHVTCPKCNTSAIVFVSYAASEIVSLGMATDLDRSEVKKMFWDEVINADDVLEAYAQVSGNNAKMSEIL